MWITNKYLNMHNNHQHLATVKKKYAMHNVAYTFFIYGLIFKNPYLYINILKLHIFLYQHIFFSRGGGVGPKDI